MADINSNSHISLDYPEGPGLPPTTTAEAALFYAATLGHTVFPAPRGEKKSHKSAEHSNGARWGATSDLPQIRKDFSKWPDANIGLPTGSETGFFVVEADTKEGHDKDGIANLAALQAQYGTLPPTRIARSPSGSMHYYFKNPSGIIIKNSASEIALGVDVRGEGGMVIAPPSIKPDKDRPYEWEAWREIAEAPDWLIELCKSQPRVQSNGADHAANPAPPAADSTLTTAIAVIPNNDLGWEDWCKVGMAIYNAFDGSEAGLQAFLQWSRKSSKFKEIETKQKWRELQSCPPDRIGAGTIFFMADQVSPIWREVSQEQHVRIAHLASLTAVQYEQQRKEVAKSFNIRVGALDGLVERLRPASEEIIKGQGTPISFELIEPWTEPVAGEKLVADLQEAIRSHVILDSEQALAVALWTMHAHGFEFADNSARLHLYSPAPRCGKTTLLDVIAELVPKPLPTANITMPALFRVIEMVRPTLLIDEADAFLKDNEDIRGMLNSGHSRSGQVLRTVGEDFEVRAFSVFTPTAIAGIGILPTTIVDRSITISLRRKKKDEKTKRLRRNRAHLSVLARRIARWIADNRDTLANADPELPEKLNDRAQDNWRLLIAIADAISPKLGKQARAAALKIADEERDDESYGTMCLADVAGIFAAQEKPKLSSQVIVIALVAMEDRPWAEWKRGYNMTPVSLAKLLKPFNLRPKKIRETANGTLRGYEAAAVKAAAERYGETKLEQGATADPEEEAPDDPEEEAPDDLIPM